MSDPAPEVLDFVKAVTEEAQYQRDRWGVDHDANKTDADWFWLIGYLAGKALHNPEHSENPLSENMVKMRLHRIITVAAAACNWHAATLRAAEANMGKSTTGG